MKILNVLLVGLALIAGTASVNAQEKAKKTPQERATMHTERMAKVLELSPDQKARVAELNLGVAMKNEAIRNDVNMTKEQKKASIQGNHEGRKAQLKTILTEEQFKKFEEHEAKMKAKHEEHKGKGKGKGKPAPETEELEEL